MRRSRTRARFVTRYLDRLGVGSPGEPSVAALRALHRAHVERVPYEVLDIQLGRPTTVAAKDCAGRVIAGRGGYCVQINNAFGLLLAELGYQVTRHRAGVQAGRSIPPVSPAEPAPHLALTVRLDDETWFVDVGLGDGLHDPLPLRSGTYRQGPLTFRLGPSLVAPGGWRFDHDARGAVVGLDIALEPAGERDFARWHPYLCTAPESRLVRALTVMRRDAAGVDTLTGCVLRRTDDSGRSERELTTPREWYDALRGVFGMPLDELDAEDRSRLWTKVWTAHQAWRTAKAAKAAKAAGNAGRDADVGGCAAREETYGGAVAEDDVRSGARRHERWPSVA